MSEIVLAVIGVASGFIGVIGGFFYVERKIKSDATNMILNVLDDLTPELPKLLAKEEVRQFIYSLGVLAGNGAKAGALGGVGRGKFKFEDLLGQILPQLLPKILGSPQDAQSSNSPSQDTGFGI
jgi:hypothetical protein